MRIFNTQWIYAVLIIPSLSNAANQTSSISVMTSIPTSCQFSNVSSQITLSEQTLSSTGNFSIQCNQKYELRLASKSLQEDGKGTYVQALNGTKLKTLIDVHFIGNIYQLDGIKNIQVDDPSSLEQGTITVSLAEPILFTTPEGLYQDVLFLNLTF